MQLSLQEKFFYGAIWAIVALAGFSIAVWLPNLETIVWFLSLPTVSLWVKIQFLVSFYGSIYTNFSALSATFTILIAVLFALSITLFVYYVRLMRGFGGAKKAGVASVGGLISGFFGIGCASCGSILATALLGHLGAGALLLYLPLGGQEFSLVAIGLLSYTSYILYKKITSPLVCEIS